ncbi:MAG TPA: PKD domain-containing protein [Lentimicrobium sp.]|nr:PKD domain-containing protein [Lentimicrobium sp.]
MKQTLKLSWVFIALLALVVVSSCKKDDNNDAKEVIAGFTYTVDATNTLMYTFTNQSQNATSYSWDFGDGQTSTDANPTHTYAAAGTFNVKLTATGAGGNDVITQPITVVNANEQLNILTGGDAKTWKLVRSAEGVFPLLVAPQDNSAVWWTLGGNEPLANRPCMLDDEWTFKQDGTMEFRANGTYWGEEKVGSTLIFAADLANTCNSTDDMRGPNGEDLSVWGDGDHQFDITNGNLTVTGLGAYIGLVKIGTGAEVAVPQESVTYEIVKLTEGDVDTLVLDSKYNTGDATPIPAYWRIVLVHYDNPNDEPPIPGPAPSAGFTISANGLTVTLTNTTTNAQGVTYTWDFGDGQTSSEANPTHTYAAAGAYTIHLSAENTNGTGQIGKMIIVSEVALTDAILQGGAWKIRNAETSIFVGPGVGSPDWWQVPIADMQEGGAWFCLMNDEFIFSAGGVYEYKTNGDARNDGYKNQPGGCFTDAELATQDFPFLSATHSYTLNTDDPAHPYIILTNGPSQAAFIGFYKGYYGGENDGNATAPNGGLNTNRYEVLGYMTQDNKEYLLLSVDLNGATEGGNGWSVVLER